MKNIVKMLGIIAMIAVIGLGVSCETDPEDQTQITILGFPTGANNKWAYIVLSKTKEGATDDQVAFAAAAKQISAGSFLNEMLNTKGEAYGDNDSLFVLVGIADTPTAAEGAAKTNPTIRSDSKKAVIKGPDNTYFTRDFSPDAVELFGTADEIVSELYEGSYTCDYLPSSGPSRTENVDLTKDSFKVSDSTDKLEFTMTKPWEKISSVPTAASSAGFTKGFKFTGNITSAKYYPAGNGESEALYGTKTAPGFNQADIDSKTEAWMFLFFDEDGKFVRTAFSKAGNNNEATIITGKTDNRVYAKK